MAHILFVERHSAFRQAASYLLEQEENLTGVLQASSVAEGHKRMAQGAIDAAIVGIPLAEEGAEELVRELQESNPPIPVLTLTHLEDWRIHQRYLAAGASEVLPKSISLEEVRKVLRRLQSLG